MIKINKHNNLLLIVLSIIFFGSFLMYSASSPFAYNQYNKPDTFFFFKQIIWLSVGILALIFLSFMNYNRLKKNAQLILFFSWILILIPILFSDDSVSRWLRIGNFTLMTTSDFARLSLIIFTAAFIDKYYQKINDLNILAKKLFPYFIITIALIVWQPDLSTSILISLIIFCLLYIAGLKNKIILTSVLSSLVLFLIVISLFEYQQTRLKNWIYNNNSQATNSTLALANGGFFGQGLGNSVFKHDGHLPEGQTDFILAIIGEEVGFLGIFIIFSLFIILFYKGINIAKTCSNRFSMFLSVGIIINIFFYFIINSGYVIGVLPTTGLPIPFVSYGGSQTVFSLISIGILMNISKSNSNNISKRSYYGRI